MKTMEIKWNGEEGSLVKTEDYDYLDKDDKINMLVDIKYEIKEELKRVLNKTFDKE